MKRTFSILLLCGTVVGCTPDAYRRSADREVSRILADREKKTLEYQPQVEVPTTAPAVPDKASYERVPVTRIAPPTTSPVEPSRPSLSYGTLGPEQKFPSGVGSPTGDESGRIATDEDSRTGGVDSLVLGPKAPGQMTQRLDLFGSLVYATAHSREYRSRMEDLYLAALDVTLQRHLFAPIPFANQTVTYNGGQADIQYASALNATTAAGVRQQLPYGGEVAAQTLVTFVNALTGAAESGESAQIVLSGSLPLLRGAGMVNLEPLIQSERSVVYAVRSFEEYRRSFALDIASAYFRLLSNQQTVNNRRTNMANLLLLLERTQALYAAGRISFLEVQRSAQAYLRAENDLIDAQVSYRNAVDDFKVLIGMSVPEELDVVGVELETTLPDLSDNMLADANKFRLSLQTAKDRIEDARRQIEVGKNGLLPDLNLNGQASVGNSPGDPARKIDAKSWDYTASLFLDLPLDRVAERNTYRRNLIDFERARRDYEVQRDAIEADVRASARAIKSSQSQLAIQSRAIELARRRLEFASELLRQGKVDARDLVEAQSDLLEAQDDYDSAKADLQIALLRFMRDSGTLRVDPEAGAIGRALNRSVATQVSAAKP